MITLSDPTRIGLIKPNSVMEPATCATCKKATERARSLARIPTINLTDQTGRHGLCERVCAAAPASGQLLLVRFWWSVGEEALDRFPHQFDGSASKRPIRIDLPQA